MFVNNVFISNGAELTRQSNKITFQMKNFYCLTLMFEIRLVVKHLTHQAKDAGYPFQNLREQISPVLQSTDSRFPSLD